MFQLTKGEFEIMRSQLVMTSKVTDNQEVKDWTSQYVTSNFVKMGLRKQPYDQIEAISTALAELQPKEPKPRRRIGFVQEEENN